jgi:hypothetical protein
MCLNADTVAASYKCLNADTVAASFIRPFGKLQSCAHYANSSLKVANVIPASKSGIMICLIRQ